MSSDPQGNTILSILQMEKLRRDKGLDLGHSTYQRWHWDLNTSSLA